MTRGRAGTLAASCGVVLLLAAAGWWWLVYRPIIVSATLSPAEALPCLFGNSGLCALAQALCRADHPLGIKHYYAEASWCGLALLSAGLLLASWRPPAGSV